MSKSQIMEKIVKQGRIIFAIAIFAFGVQHFVWARSAGPTVPIIPFVPAIPWLAYLTGVALLAAGLCIASNIRARLAEMLLGTMFLLCDLSLEVSQVAAHPFDIGIRTVAFEILILCASAFTLAGILPKERNEFGPLEGVVSSLIKSGPYLFAISSVVFGVSHFLIPRFIASLIPAWIPGPGLFWAYLTGVIFIASGVTIGAKWMDFWGGFFLGLMFLLWFLLLHAPRIMTNSGSHKPAEWSSAFIALAIGGGSWIVAWSSLQRRSQDSN